MERWEMILSRTNKELDVVTYIREHLPENGELDLAALLQDVQKRESTPSDVREGDSCFEMMAVAEIVMGCLHDDLSGLDDEKKGMGQHQKSQSITSFTAGKKDILRLRDYLCDSLYYARKYVLTSKKLIGGDGFMDKDWHNWQEHMGSLIQCLDGLLVRSEGTVDLCSAPSIQKGEMMQTSFFGITQDTFVRELQEQFSCSEQAASRWIQFAEECVKESQYVEFQQITNGAAEKNRWMEATLAGLIHVRNTIGLDAAQKVCELASVPQCLYPFEMIEAAKCLQNGGSLEDIVELIENGTIINDKEEGFLQMG